MTLASTLSTGAAALALLGTVALPVAASAQSTAVPVPEYSADGDYSDAPPPPGADAGYYGDQDGGYADQDGAYDGPPEGYDAPPPPQALGPNARPEDREYAQRYAEWQRQRGAYEHGRYYDCVRQKRTGTVVGAVLGGIAGAVIGSNVAGRFDRTEGAVAGGAIGAVAGGAIGSTAGGHCPPGYVYGPVGYGRPYYGGPVYGAPVYGAPYYGGYPYYGGPAVGVGVVIGGPRYRYYRPWRPYRPWRRGYWRRW